MNAWTHLLAVMLCTSLPLTAACGSDDVEIEDNEAITTVILQFTPAGGAPITATFDDPDGDGGTAPTVDPITLVAGTSYTTTVRFQNRLEDPAEEITDEVRDEGEDHQVFLTGTAINGPATSSATAALTHTYADQDLNGLPLGLSHTLVAAAGTGSLTLTLRHLPPVNGTAVKVAGLAEQVKAGGFAAIAGTTDVEVDFIVTVR